jgi:hypothetical protein
MREEKWCASMYVNVFVCARGRENECISMYMRDSMRVFVYMGYIPEK